MSGAIIFADRRDAGRQLAARLRRFASERPIVLGLPRGGVPVAAEVARALEAPLDVLTVRKLGAPAQPELAIGAVAEGGAGVLDPDTARRAGVTEAELGELIERERAELARRTERFHRRRPPPDVRARTVIVVDDGLATGLSDLAAVQALKERAAGRIVVAAPVASPEAVAILRRAADEVVTVIVPERLRAVGECYRDFHQVSDDEVVALLGDAGATPPEVHVEAVGVRLRGDLLVPPQAAGLVVFAHGSGSSRLSPRNRAVARRLRDAGLGTLLVDLLAEEEEGRRDLVFDIDLLARRLEAVVRWARAQPAAQGLRVSLFGASTGAAAALRAAAALGDVPAVVSRGGRPDLAGDALLRVRSATLLVVGSRDREVLELNRRAAARIPGPVRLEVVPGAGHLFEEPGTLEAVAELAARWFLEHREMPAGPRADAAEA